MYQEKDGKVIYAGKMGPDVVAHLLGDPQSLHPTNSSLIQKDEILMYVYEKLLTLDMKDGSLVPILVKDLPEVSADGLTYSFQLREEARWKDGSPIKAKDILFNFKLLFCQEIENGDAKSYVESLEDVVIDESDPLKFSLRMSEAYFLNPYLGTLSMMLNPRFYDPQGVFEDVSIADLKAGKTNEAISRWAEEFNDIKYGREVRLLQGGSGPYEVSEWAVDQKIVLTRREDYWGKDLEGKYFSQYPSQVSFQMVKDEQALVEAIRQQSIDVSTKLSLNAFRQLSGDSLVDEHYKVVRQSRSTIVQLILNNRPDGISQMPVFDDSRVRKAAQLALPLDEIMYDKLETDFVRANGPMAPGNPHNDPDLKPFAHDPGTAKKLLEEAGWTDEDGDGKREKMIDGREVALRFALDFPPQNQLIIDMMDLMKEAWEEVGFEVELKPQGLRAYLPSMTSGQFDVSLLPLGAPPALPFDYHQNYFSENWPDGGNYSGYANAEVDSLITLIRKEVDPTKRQNMAFEVNKILEEEVPVIYLYQPSKKMALHRRFTNGIFYKIPPYIRMNNLELNR